MTRSAGYSVKHILTLLKLANNDLSRLEHVYDNLKSEVSSLEAEKQTSTRIIEDYNNHINGLGQRFADCCMSCEEEGARLNELQQRPMKLQALVRRFENNDSEYIKIRKVVEIKVQDILSNSKDFVNYAVLSVTETMRNNPEKYRPLVSCSTPSIYRRDMEYQGSYMYGQKHQHTSTEDYMSMLTKESDKLYNMILKDQIDQIIDNYDSLPMTSISSLTPISSSDG
jgi:hypothetical protein